MKKPLNDPNFKSEDEERDFWDKLDLTEYFEPEDFSRISHPKPKPTAEPSSLMPNYNGNDIYCDLIIPRKIDVEIVKETDQILAYKHTKPHWPVHIVVTPKKHVASLLELAEEESELKDDLLAVITEVSKTVMEKRGACAVLTNLGTIKTPSISISIFIANECLTTRLLTRKYNKSYTQGMKTAISIPNDVFASAEELAKKLGRSRSQLYTQALHSFVETHHADDITKKLDTVYGQTDSSLNPLLQTLQSRSLSKDRW